MYARLWPCWDSALCSRCFTTWDSGWQTIEELEDPASQDVDMNGSQFSADDMAEYLDLKQQVAVKSVRASFGVCATPRVPLCPHPRWTLARIVDTATGRRQELAPARC